MEISFQDPAQVPLAPQETCVRALRAEPWPDGRRVQVQIEVTPFQQRPNLHVCILDAQGFEAVSMVATEILQTQLALTLHLRHLETRGRYTVAAFLAYPDLELDGVGRAEASFEIT